MEGIFIQKEGTSQPNINQNQNRLTFLAGGDSTEIMVQTIHPDSLTYITPGDDPKLMEFFYVLDGELTLVYNHKEELINTGESFYVLGIEKEVLMKCTSFVKLLYVTSKPIFSSLRSYLDDLNDLLIQTDEKDKYTYGHGKRVMEYSIKLCDELNITGNILDNISVSSLFHDVGKCYTPSHILNKPEKLTLEEYQCIMKHPVHSRILLEKHFGNTIAEIAESHHERLDGSGYPYGLTAESIGIEGRIIAVADTFDAMTTDRPYKLGKPHDVAIEELEDLAERGMYDSKVVQALKNLYIKQML